MLCAFASVAAVCATVLADDVSLANEFAAAAVDSRTALLAYCESLVKEAKASAMLVAVVLADDVTAAADVAVLAADDASLA